MKTLTQRHVLVLTATALLLSACGKDAQPKAALDTDKAKFSYAIGTKLGEKMATTKDEIDLVALKAGLEDSFSGKPLQLQPAALNAAITKGMQDIAKQQQSNEEQMAKKNLDAGAAFLAANGKKAGVKTTASGLQYTVQKEGNGTHPTDKDVVTINYRGTLLDGTEFDSSYARHEPATFPVTGVIPGFSEGIKLMSPGAKYTLYIPSNLAYGPSGAGPKVQPNSTLTFEVEMISAQSAEAAAKAAAAKPAAAASQPAAH